MRLKQERQKERHDSHSRKRAFAVGDRVLARDFVNNRRSWTSGVFTELHGPLSFHVRLDDGRVIRRHMDHLCADAANNGHDSNSDADMETWDATEDLSADSTLSTDDVSDPPPPPVASELRRSTRQRQPPDRYQT